MRGAFFILLLVTITVSWADDISAMMRDFPLWGRTYIVGKGRNHRAYPSFARLEPTHLIKVTFPSGPGGGEFVYEWANLTRLNYRSTGHLINEALSQFARNRIAIPYSVWSARSLDGRDTLMAIARRTAPDTLWSCDEAFTRNLSNHGNSRAAYSLGQFVLSVNDTGGVDTLRYGSAEYGAEAERRLARLPANARQRGNWLWHRNRPTAFGVMPFDGDNRRRFSVAGNLTGLMDSRDTIYYKPGDMSDRDFIDYCADNRCYEEVICNAMLFPPQDFWQAHFFPVVRWYPRVWRSGTPIETDSRAMSFWQARERRRMSLEYINNRGERRNVIVADGGDTIPDNVSAYISDYMRDKRHRRLFDGDIIDVDGSFSVHARLDSLSADARDFLAWSERSSRFVVVTGYDWRDYRRPYFSDSASTIISVQFRANRSDPNFRRGIVMTSISDTGSMFDDFYIDRLPNRMIEVRANTPIEVERAILRLYAEDERDDERFGRMAERCGNAWRAADVRIGEEFRFPPILAAGGGGEMGGFPFQDGSRGSGFRQGNMGVAGGTTDELIMDSNYVSRRFIYNHCPCLPIVDLNGFTADDLRSIAYRTPPLCDEGSMANGLFVLLNAVNHITQENDRRMLFRRIIQIGDALEERVALNRRLTPSQVAQATKFCPDTWEVNFRDNAGRHLYRSRYTEDLRSEAARFRPYRNNLDIGIVSIRNVNIRR